MMVKLTRAQLEQVRDCGPDAQAHDVILDQQGILRFKADPFTRKLCNLVNLNDLWAGLDLTNQAERLSLRKFYRDIGYSICGYLDIFGEQLDEEEGRKERP